SDTNRAPWDVPSSTSASLTHHPVASSRATSVAADHARPVTPPAPMTRPFRSCRGPVDPTSLMAQDCKHCHSETPALDRAENKISIHENTLCITPNLYSNRAHGVTRTTQMV